MIPLPSSVSDRRWEKHPAPIHLAGTTRFLLTATAIFIIFVPANAEASPAMRIITFSLCLAAVAFAGCRSCPFLPAPGPIGLQQAQAVVHDPYPSPDIGHEDAAARPRDYQDPIPQPRRDRMFYDGWFGR